MDFAPIRFTGPLEDLQTDRPRLSLTPHRAEELRSAIAAAEDAALLKCWADALARAERMCKSETLRRDLIQGRLLQTAHRCVDRMYALGLAWQLTGQQRFAEAAWQTLEQVAGFDDWNPGHELDFCEMAHGVAIGLDWLWQWLDQDRREQLGRALVEKALTPALEKYTSQNGPKWAGDVLGRYNWNQVCNGGLIVAALSAAEFDPDRSAQVLGHAISSLPKALATYDPDGMWGEGSDYWHYGTIYTCYAFSAMQTALGHDFGLSNFPGFDRTGRWVVLTQGPTGRLPNFADNGKLPNYTENSQFAVRRPLPELFYIAGRFDESLLGWDEHETLQSHPAAPEHVLWYYPRPEKSQINRPLDIRFAGEVELACFRSAWDDPEAMALTIKGGFNRVNHGHLDLGTFELDAMGVRWAVDLGKEEYSVPGYWSRHKDEGRRWTYFRCASRGHNVVVVEEENQRLDGVARFTHFDSRPDSASVVMDLSNAYKPWAQWARRGAGLRNGRKSAIVQDELMLHQRTRVHWQMLTGAKVATRGQRAELTQDGKRLILEAIGSSSASFSAESVEAQADPESDNPGITRVRLSVSAPAGLLTIGVRFLAAGQAPFSTSLVPLANWTGLLPAAQKGALPR